MKFICGKEIWIIMDYFYLGDEYMICMSYLKLVEYVLFGIEILCLDGIIIFMVLECDVVRGMVRCRCENIIMFGEKKNVNLFGVVVDLLIIMMKDIDDIV